MSVSTQHPEYKEALGRWKLIRAIINNNASSYIRSPDVNDDARTKQYRADAILTNFTNFTKLGLVGLVFRKEPEYVLPSEIEYIDGDATGAGVSLLQFSQKLVGELLQTGRHGILIDYHDDGMRSYLKPYCAESIINWKTDSIDGEYVPILVTLCEEVLVDDEDPFCQDTKKNYRVLRLMPSDDGHEYQQWIFDEDEALIDVITPRDFNGKPFNRIPFIFIGSENNDPYVDYQPLYDMAAINLGHYRNSADYEENIFISGQTTIVLNIGEASKEDFDSANPNGIMLGSRKGIVLQGSGNASLLQANENQLVAKAMSDKIEQAAYIGARMIATSGGRETAEAVRVRYGSQNSALISIANNVQEAIEASLEVLCQFQGVASPEVEFKLNDVYFEETADANLLAQQILLLDRGVISREEILDYGRKTGFISDAISNDEIANNVDVNFDPLLGAMSDNTAGRNTKASINSDASSVNPSESD
jgi:hypothetical protein